MILANKIVIVSGIGPGLGTALAEIAAMEGAGVAICARTPAKLAACEAAISRMTGGGAVQVLSVPTDITDPDQCAAFAERVMATFGRIDVLINSAYVTGEYGPSLTVDLGEWRKALDVNLFGTMNMTRAVVPHMTAGGGGSIVNVNTKVARMPHEALGGYAVSKAALRMATTQLAKELHGTGIRINSAFPGWMWGKTVADGLQETADQRGITVEEVRDGIAKAIPIGRMPEDREVAKAIIALASDYFTATTGACLDLSGGEYMPL
ncbi:MAG: family oxidoreductase [Sphingomonadales bacterium]|nr:family oxidoreductase [Sphingomonadales bacterium]